MSEIEKVYYINIDITDTLEYPSMEFVQNDTLNEIILNISNNGEPVNDLSLYNYKVFVKRPDGIIVCKIPEIVNNRLQYVLGTTEISVVGICKCSIEIYEGLNKITTKGFSFIVIKSLNDTTVTESETQLHIQYDYNDLVNKPDIPDIPYDNFDLINSGIQGTTQNVVFNTDGTIQKVQHKDSLNNIIREDSFTYETNIIKEIRTLLSTDKTLTFVYHLDNLITEVI